MLSLCVLFFYETFECIIQLPERKVMMKDMFNLKEKYAAILARVNEKMVDKNNDSKT